MLGWQAVDIRPLICAYIWGTKMNRIRHIAIAARDPGKAADFYIEAFGWTEIARRFRKDDPK